MQPKAIAPSSLVNETSLRDPLSGKSIKAIRAANPAGVEYVTIPDRALDIYALCFRGKPVSHTDARAGISPENFVESGTQGFAKNFFVGFLTTCGLINAGRPCEEDGRAFGLHGRISNTPCTALDIAEDMKAVRLTGTMDEIHPEGEHMRLVRTLSLFRADAALEIHDRITNLSAEEAPYMIMYHINFGEPFLSEQTRISANFSYIENRDTGITATAREAVRMGAKGSTDAESVYYTRADLLAGVRLESPSSGVRALITARGDGLDWMGLWKSHSSDRYAIAIEPCNCPGLGRAGARLRGLLPVLASGETRENRVRVDFEQL